MIDPDFDPYEQLISLSNSHFAMAQALNDQAGKIDELIRCVNSLSQRVNDLETIYTEFD